MAEEPDPICVCNETMKKCAVCTCKDVWCDGCKERVEAEAVAYHCPKEKASPQHVGGYDLCAQCGQKSLLQRLNIKVAELSDLGSEESEALRNGFLLAIQKMQDQVP